MFLLMKLRNQPMRLIHSVLVFTYFVLYTSVAQAEQSFAIVAGKSYSVAVFAAGEKAKGKVLAALHAQKLPQDSEGRLLLQSLDGATLVELIAWNDETEALAYKARYFPSVQIYWQRVFSLVGENKKSAAEYVIKRDSAVQWSEFLMRDPVKLPQLQTTVNAMVTGMVLGGPETLLSVQQLRAKGDMSLGLLGVWSEPEGFYVFEKNQTFGEQPYWSHLADNAHWMMRVVSIQ